MFKLKIKREFTIQETLEDVPVSITFKPLAEEDKGGLIAAIKDLPDENARLMKLYWGSIRESIVGWTGFGYDDENGDFVELPMKDSDGKIIQDHVTAVMDLFMVTDSLQKKYFTALENTSAKN